MNIFIDTAAFLAILNASDKYYASAKRIWDEMLLSDSKLFSSNYIVLETTALLQHRFGVEAVRLFNSDILPVVEIVWIDNTVHRQGLGALLTANNRNLSLVDCTSFEIIRIMGLDQVFTFDIHFCEQGFTVVPGSDIL